MFYTDGVTEARAGEPKELFGLERLKRVVARFTNDLPLPACADLVGQAVHDYTGSDDLQDDVTVFLLRRTEK